MVALCNRADHYILRCGFYLSSSFFPFLASSQLSEIGRLPYFRTWCGLSANLECMSETCCTRLAENTGRKNDAKNRHLGIIAQVCHNYGMYRQSEKNLLSSDMSSICPRNIRNFSLLTAEVCWRVRGTSANFNGFRVLASLLQRRRSTEVDQSLHYVRPYPDLVYCIYIFGSSVP